MDGHVSFKQVVMHYEDEDGNDHMQNGIISDINKSTLVKPGGD